jgi:hypothetical protein
MYGPSFLARLSAYTVGRATRLEDGMPDPTLNLPESPDEPKPWTVSVWRHHREERRPFTTREAAIDAAHASIEFGDEYGECYTEGVYRPDGTLDEDAMRSLRPWKYRDRDKVTFAN